MGFFHLFRESALLWVPRTQSRRYHAALAVLLAIHRLPQLDGSDKARIDAELVQVYKPLGLYPWWRFRSDASPVAMAGIRAVAMYRLGIPTGVEGLRWESVLHPLHRQSPTLLIQDFSTNHPATDEAIQLLVSHGVPPTEIERFGKRWLDDARAKYASDA